MSAASTLETAVGTAAVLHRMALAVEALDGSPDPPDGAAAAGRAGADLDPADPSAWTDVLGDWLTDPGLRGRWRAAALTRRGRLRRWEDTARDVLAAIGPLLDRPFDPSDPLGRSPDHDPDRTRRPS